MLGIGIFRRNNRKPTLVGFNLVRNRGNPQMGPTRERSGVSEPMTEGKKEESS